MLGGMLRGMLDNVVRDDVEVYNPNWLSIIFLILLLSERV